MPKNLLDEMQEQRLLKIEHNGVWFCFWALAVAIIVQQLLGVPFVQFAGEMIIFAILAVYLLVSCLKAGIWDRHLRPTLKTNLIISTITAIVFSSVVTVIKYIRYEACRENLFLTLGIFVIIAVQLFILCFIALWLTSRIYKRRRNCLEDNCEIEKNDR
ncbi:hypothetical protein UNSWDHB_1531 [Dehalobacter sp. UNSWDHB]|uniref:DUF6773 family protein n=1 Tax=unclassified Dehalobacter TaxID=2635733 RepID=UPI00028AC892|nr:MULTISPECIES: DUF6773 family protein [unclassified Dehalobacter]AFV03130.1 hypothetical protein DHBDCA_p2103 [Dehalobacter sp. DCA]AFV06118.1 hypothetical protein DCF50_p2115 [Dehalobacter sp. CF]EQB21143.1 hypothetical protein UNSWDHB_1531 [Dehalobacter sp. UNSWDHB]